jgi:outer membrane protein assembly factor BamA
MQANYIHSLGYVPEAETIHLGGYYNGVRGYRSGSLHPKGGGGYKSVVNSIEASIPLSQKNKVRLTAFADYGIVSGPTGKATGKSVGAQLEWRSPMGDVNFVFAKRLNKQGKPSSFEFTIGKEF